MTSLKEKFAEVAIPYAKKVKNFVTTNHSKKVSEVTLAQLYGGMRGVVSLTTETSKLDPSKGIAFRGYSIDDIYTQLPKINPEYKQPLPEVVFLLFLLGRLPTQEEVTSLSKEWHSRSHVPSYVYKAIDALPTTSHSMVKFTVAMAALQTESEFSKAYSSGIAKSDHWSYVYEDSMNIIAKLPKVVSYISGVDMSIKSDESLDWAGNMAHLLGDKDSSRNSLMKEFMRLYSFLHSDHEGGNGSAFTCHVVGSTLANPYASFTAAMESLSGPLHGLACQNMLDWLKNLISISKSQTPDKLQISDYINKSLANNQVVPGYGHAVLRKTDPRFTALMNFAKSNNITSNLLEAVWNTYEVAPEILGKIGKIKNPFPNVDAHSGAMLNYFGFKNQELYTVYFGASRALGIMASQIWDRVMMLPLHRPSSTTSDLIMNNF